MITQRGEVAAVAKIGAKQRAPAAAAAPAPAIRKMSFKEQHELKTLTADIATLNARIAAHQAVLGEPALFARDAKRFDSVSAALARDTRALETAEGRWLELEVLREEAKR